MEIKEFFWTEKTIVHIARHKVLPDEVEEVAFDDDPYVRKGKQGVRSLFGQTVTGKYLFIVYVLDKDSVAEVVTAREMSAKERKYYKREGAK